MKLFRMKHRSLVRIIASIIPEFMWNFFLPVTPRMYISSSVMDKILSLKNNDVQSDDESFSSFKSHLSSNKDAAILYSTPLKYKSKDNSRLRELQRELDEIQKQLTKLMEHQCDQFHSSSYQMINGSTQQRTVW